MFNFQIGYVLGGFHVHPKWYLVIGSTKDYFVLLLTLVARLVSQLFICMGMSFSRAGGEAEGRDVWGWERAGFSLSELYYQP